MPTLLVRLEGPMQSWGVQSRFTVRDTGLEPSKSGVVGLLCAACGIARDDEPAIARIAACRMGVRIDRPGRMERDFQTVGGGVPSGRESYGVYKAGTAPGSKAAGDTALGNRYYLADASFLVGLESEDRALLEELDRALADPVWPLFLGRKAFPPSRPLREGVAEAPLAEALRGDGAPPGGVRYVLECDRGDEAGRETLEVRPDQPLCFETGRRRFALRRVRSGFWRPEGEEVVACSSLD